MRRGFFTSFSYGSCVMIAMSDLFRVSLRQVVRQRGFGVILSIALGITAFIAFRAGPRNPV